MNDVYINKKLKQLFGEQGGDANFRLARTNELEYRRNHMGEVVLVPRYNYFKMPYWALERLMIVSGPNAELLPGKSSSYEPIFVFKKPDDTPMSVSEDAVLSFVHIQLFGEKKKRDLVKEELDQYERQVDYLTQFLNDECSVMSTQLHIGEAVVNSKEKFNGRRDISVPSPEGNSGIQAGSDGTTRNDSSSTVE